jgi:hypothetical protein
MKAQKAAAVCLLAGCIAYLFPAWPSHRAAAAEEAETIIAAETVAADADGHFTANILLEKLPETGLCAAEFAIAYDTAALTITNVKLLYDTGAQKQETLANPGLAGTVFSYEKRDGAIWVRWATALTQEYADYWLREERPFFSVSGTLTDAVSAGTSTELRIVPANGESADAQITAGYLDADDNAHYCRTAVRSGAVWRPIDETGATMYGDLNLDGTVSVADAVMLHQVIAEELALSAAAYANADCEFDGLLTMGDVTLMLRYLNQMTGDTALGAH